MRSESLSSIINSDLKERINTKEEINTTISFKSIPWKLVSEGYIHRIIDSIDEEKLPEIVEKSASFKYIYII